MSTQSTLLAEAATEQFVPFMTALWEHLKLLFPDLPTDPQNGIGQGGSSAVPFSYALDQPNKFAAVQWGMVSAQGCPATRFEAFFVCPASKTPKCGIRVVTDNLTDEKQESLTAWWTSLFPGYGLAEPADMPSFLDLACVLSSKGNVAIVSAPLRSALQESEYEAAYYRKLSEDLSAELRSVRTRLRDGFQPRGNTAESESPLPNEVSVIAEDIVDLSGISEWAEKNRDRIIIHQRAINSSKKSRYLNPAAIYAALELLAGPYREHRSGLLDKESFQSAMGAVGIQIEGSVARTTAGSYGDAYYVSFEGRRRFMDLHVVKGGGRDERYCMRIYFFWDADLLKVVVGWMPSHLINSLA